MPEVSVVLPTFNRWPILSRGLATVLTQTGVDLEVIVVDDCSSDETAVRLAELRDPRLRVIRQETNQGVARARNRGIAAARGEWVAFLDDDDFWAPTRLADHLRTIVAAGAEWGYGAAVTVGLGGAIENLMVPGPVATLESELLEANVVGPPSTATVKLDLLREAGGFDDRLSVIADWDLWIRLGRRARAARCGLPLVAYCVHPANMHVLQRAEQRHEIDYLDAKHRDLLPPRRRFGARASSRRAAVENRLAGRRLRAAAGFVRIGVRERSATDVLRGIGLIGGEPAVARLKTARRREVVAPSWLAAAARASTEDLILTADGATVHAPAGSA